MFLGVKGLPPADLGAWAGSDQFDAEQKVVTRNVFDLEEFTGHKAGETAFVRVVRSIGAMHGEKPRAARVEVELVNGVGEAIRTPPTRDPFRKAQCGKDLGGGSSNKDAA